MEVPGVVAAYNRFMNIVDRMNQLRDGGPTRRREVRLYMSILSWCLDISEIYKQLRKEYEGMGNMSIEQFKMCVVESFVERSNFGNRVVEQPAPSIVHNPNPRMLLKSEN